MWLDNASQELVDEFWRKCGEVEPYPRRLERSLALATPVALVKLPRLKLLDIEMWLRRRGVPFRFGCESRLVRGCLVAYRGQGMIFVDGADPEDERRFTLAHEIGHFLMDYWHPRQVAIDKFGPEIADVVDGVRPPTTGERVSALLGSVRINVYTDLMERDKRLDDMSGALWQIEDQADRIALALLAPPEVVRAQADMSAGFYDERQDTLTTFLHVEFGLPIVIANSYSHSLLKAAGRGRSWLEMIGLR
jgi:hypothetical protein